MGDAVAALISSAMDVIFARTDAKHRETPWEQSWFKIGMLAALALIAGLSAGFLLRALI